MMVNMDEASSKPEVPTDDLLPFECFWRDNYDWFLSRGYQLRSRYKPDWIPSWRGTKKLSFTCPDGAVPFHPSVLDARRSDGERLMLKCIEKSLHPYEAEIGQYFSSPELLQDTNNHCVPIYEVLHPPGDEEMLVLVMPLLRPHDDPRFDTTGEVIEMLHQVFEVGDFDIPFVHSLTIFVKGLQFMHKHHVAHRDVALLNVMMDARSLYTEDYHPSRPSYRLDMNGLARHSTRTQTPVRYYLTDFGLSRRYKPEDLPVLEDVIIGGDRTVPEFQTSEACDPFPSDIYTLGNMIKEEFIEGSKLIKRKRGFDFLKPLVADMTQSDPTKRPTIGQVIERFEEIRSKLSTWTLRSRVIEVNESYFSKVYRGIGHWKRKFLFVLRNVPPVPHPT
ncbi:hypothetical protein ONZ45_g7197 [Pleurotus djamor]|nr:hypothetical protein ONZ45_g7197 [Pleurotus djamor]